MRVVLEAAPLSRIRRDAYENLLAKSVLGVIGDAYLFFNGSHQLFVRVHLLFGDGVFDALLVAVGFDVVQVVIAHSPRHLFKGIDEGALHLYLRKFVVLLARSRNQIQVAVALVRANACVLLEAVFDCAERVNRIDAGDTIAHERA